MIYNELKKSSSVFLVAPLFLSRYSGSEEQAQRFYKRLKSTTPYSNIYVISLSKTQIRKFLTSSVFVKIILLLSLSFKLISIFYKKKSEENSIVLWGLVAFICALPMNLLPKKNTIIFATERQWSHQVKKRKWFYRLFHINYWFFNSSFTLEQFTRFILDDNASCVLTHNNKNIELKIAEKEVRKPVEVTKPIGVISRVNKSKNLELAITFCVENGISELVYFGEIEDPNYRNQLTAIAKSLAINVAFEGKINKRKIFDQCDIFVHTSEAEGMPNSLLEAIIFRKIIYCVDALFLDEINFPRAFRFNANETKKDIYFDASRYVDEFASSREIIGSW